MSLIWVCWMLRWSTGESPGNSLSAPSQPCKIATLACQSQHARLLLGVLHSLLLPLLPAHICDLITPAATSSVQRNKLGRWQLSTLQRLKQAPNSGRSGCRFASCTSVGELFAYSISKPQLSFMPRCAVACCGDLAGGMLKPLGASKSCCSS